ncbi:MAG: alpha/beta hydrolase [Bacteroidota bacterium]
MANTTQIVNRPSLFKLLTEPPRAIAELGAFMASRPFLKKFSEGDGHVVLVLPGFMTSDGSTGLLREFLNKRGYDARPWELGRNYGSPKYVDQIMEKVRSIVEEERKEVSLIGWSLGGVYAREVARRSPNSIRQVITLGSPFGGIRKENNATWLYHLMSGKRIRDIDENAIRDILQSPPVPMTAIFSKGDGIVAWQHCMELKEGPRTQNIQVTGSHCGLGVNPSVIICIMDRLAQPIDTWKPFRPKWYKQFLYPNLAFSYLGRRR